MLLAARVSWPIQIYNSIMTIPTANGAASYSPTGVPCPGLPISEGLCRSKEPRALRLLSLPSWNLGMTSSVEVELRERLGDSHGRLRRKRTAMRSRKPGGVMG